MAEYKAGPKLEQIQIPSDMREKFTVNDLPEISDEVRQYIVDVISEIGNSHFGASLGVVVGRRPIAGARAGPVQVLSPEQELDRVIAGGDIRLDVIGFLQRARIVTAERVQFFAHHDRRRPRCQRVVLPDEVLTFG